MMWRGATEFPEFLDGRTMFIGGGMGAKFVLYPIAEAGGGKKLTNWVVNVRVADGATQPPPKDSWSRRGRLDDVLPYAKRFSVPGVDIEALVRATDAYYEYPMCDRDPLPQWTFGRVTLLGDAAHPMYPVGSNGASQAIRARRSSMPDAWPTPCSGLNFRQRRCMLMKRNASPRPQRSFAPTARVVRSV